MAIGAGCVGGGVPTDVRRARAEQDRARRAGDLEVAVERSLRLRLDGRRLPGAVGGAVDVGGACEIPWRACDTN